jgi:hypothetical protein
MIDVLKESCRVIGLAIVLALFGLIITGCTSPGEHAAQICADAKLAVGTRAYENCVLARLPAGE